MSSPIMKMLQKEIEYKDDLIQKYAEKQYELGFGLQKRDELLSEAIQVIKFYEEVDKNDEYIVGKTARSFLDKPEIKDL